MDLEEVTNKNYDNVRKNMNAYILNLICRSRNIPIFINLRNHHSIFDRIKKKTKNLKHIWF